MIIWFNKNVLIINITFQFVNIIIQMITDKLKYVHEYIAMI